MTWGVGTIIMLFYNGVILGAIAVDYIMAGQTKFLLGWLLPHGVIEIPAILIAGQAGLVLADALIGWGRRMPLAARLRAVSRDLDDADLRRRAACWYGRDSSRRSCRNITSRSFHTRLKIAFGLVELVLLCLFLARSGRRSLESQSSSMFQVPVPGWKTLSAGLPERGTRNPELRTHEVGHASNPHAGRHRVLARAGRAGDAFPGLGGGSRLHLDAGDGAELVR